MDLMSSAILAPASSGEEMCTPQCLNRIHHFLPEHPSPRRAKPKCSISMLPVFVGPVLLLTAVVATCIWLTTNQVAANSVDVISQRLHDFLKMHLDAKIRSLLLEMTIAARFGATMVAGETDWVKIERFLIRSMYAVHHPLYLIYCGMDRKFTAGNRGATGTIAVGNRPSGPNGNLTVTAVSENGAYGKLLSTFPYDPFERPWYVAMAENGFRPMFSPPYVHVFEPFMGVSLGVPVHDPAGALVGVFVVDYSLASIEHALQDAYDTLRTSGIMILTDTATGAVLAVAGNQAQADIDAISASQLADGAVAKVTLPELGSCFMVCSWVTGEGIDEDFRAGGLSWRLIIAIPEREYYGQLWKNNAISAAILAGWGAVFLIVKVTLFYFLLSRPLRNLRRRLQDLKESAANSFHHSSFVGAEKTSVFAEIQGLQLAAIDALVAVEEVSRLRSQEAAQAAEAERAKEHAEAMMKSKEMFFAMMSHEMRTPLTACIGMAQILLETTTLDQKQRECAQAIEGSGNTLLTLINDLLDLSKMEADKITLEHLAFSIRDCIEQSISIVQSKAEEKGLELIAFISSRIPTYLMGDSCRLRQVLLNLLSNSIKFTAKGMVQLNCQYIEEDASAGKAARVRLEVSDTGIGLNGSTIKRLFQPFTQADASTSRKFGGTGLGLSISKRLVELMGGSLSVESDGEGRGSKFWFELPCTPIPETVRSPAHTSIMSLPANTRMLVVDKNKQRRAAVCELLQSLSASYQVIDDIGDLSSEHASFPVALVHNVDGFYDSLDMNTLRNEYTPPGTTRHVILVTKMKELVSGFGPDAVCVSQPVTAKKLRNALLDCLNLNFSCPSHSISASQSSDTFKHSAVLIVDDVALNQRVLTLKLQQLGFAKVDAASSGREALELIRKSVNVYDLILMDVMMPEMDGYETTRQIKADYRYTHVPIIAITGISDPNVSLKCTECGMVADVLGKPFDTDKIRSLVSKYLGCDDGAEISHKSCSTNSGSGLGLSPSAQMQQQPPPPQQPPQTLTPLPLQRLSGVFSASTNGLIMDTCTVGLLTPHSNNTSQHQTFSSFPSLPNAVTGPPAWETLLSH